MARPKTKRLLVEKNIDIICNYKMLGMNDVQVCQRIGLSVECYHDALNEKPELRQAINNAKMGLCKDLRSELVRMALPHKVTTRKQTIREDIEGKPQKYMEITTRELDGNTAAIHLLLKNIDRDNWKNDWDDYENKKELVKIREELAKWKMSGGFDKEDVEKALETIAGAIDNAIGKKKEK